MKTLSFLFFLTFFSSALCAQTWEKLYKQADSLLQKRDFKNAIPFYEQALNLAEKEYGKKHENYLKIRNGLGESMISVESKEKTEAFLVENLTLSKEQGEKTALYTQSLHNLGVFYLPSQKGNQIQKSETYLLQTLQLRKEIVGNKHKDYATTLNSLAILYRHLEKYQEAEAFYKEVIAIRKELFGEKHPEYLLTINNLASLYFRVDNYLKAETLYKETLQIRKEILGVKHPDYTQSLNNLASLYFTLNNYPAAEKLYQEVLQIRKEALGEKHPDYARILQNLGALYKNLGRINEAEKSLKEALETRKEILGIKHNDYANSLNSLAVLYSDTDQDSIAEQYYLQALAIQKETFGEKHGNYLRNLSNLATLYQKKEKYEESERLFDQVLRTYQANLSQYKPSDYARSLGNVSELYRSLHRYALADSLVRIELSYRNQDVPTMDLFWGYNNLGNIQQDRGQYAEAEKTLLKSAELLKKLHSGKTMTHAYQFYDLGRLYWQTRQYPKALEAFSAMRDHTQSYTQENLPNLNEFEKEGFYAKSKKYFNHFNSFALFEHLRSGAQTLGDLYDVQLFSKGVLLNASQKLKNRILFSRDSALIKDFEKWTNLRLSLAKYAEMSQEDLRKANIPFDSLTKVVNEMETDLSKRSEPFSKISEKQNVTWQDIKNKLKKDEAAVEIIRLNKFGVKKIVTDTTDFRKNPVGFKNPQGFPKYPFYTLTDTVHYAALIVRHDSKQPELVWFAEGNDLENRYFKIYHNAAKYQLLDTNSYKHYWKAIKDKLKDVKKVYFSPDGVYNQLNMNILQNPKDLKFLLDEIDLHQVTNTKEILTFKQKTFQDLEKDENFRATLFGRPAYDMDSISFLADIELAKNATQNYALRDLRDLRSGKFSDLLGTEKEVNVIDSLLRARNLRTEKYILGQATETKLKTIRNPNILHIATHGFFIKDSASRNPMLNSGILLAGVSNYFRSTDKPDTEDGVLTAIEAQNLYLDETDLVALSACETGLGEVRNGEGVYGLQRAFKAAGADALLMSHWKVDDQVTQELMTAFYRNWIKMQDKRKAFQEAQKQVRKKYPQPYYWGAFVLIGQ